MMPLQTVTIKNGSMHTFEVCYKIYRTEYAELKGRLLDLGGYPGSNNGFFYEAWYLNYRALPTKQAFLNELRGMRIVLESKLQKGTNFHHFKLKLIVNPQAVVEYAEGDMYTPTHLYQYGKETAHYIAQKVKKVSDVVLQGFESRPLHITRADACLDCKLDSAYEVDMYINLVRKARPAYNAELEGGIYDAISHRIRYPANEVQFCGKSFALVFYSKQAQIADVISRGYTRFSAEDYATAEGILRIELQNSRKRLARTCNTREIELFLKDFLDRSVTEIVTFLTYFGLNTPYLYMDTYEETLNMCCTMGYIKGKSYKKAIRFFELTKQVKTWAKIEQVYKTMEIDVEEAVSTLRKAGPFNTALALGRSRKDGAEWYYPSLLSKLNLAEKQIDNNNVTENS
ncbi:MAG: hypothetical protein ACLSWV_03525 [Pygmaiobacter massiliensis]